jgi:hypothetical protein
MLIYSIEFSQAQNSPSVKTLYMEGSVDLWGMERLKRAISDALVSCDHLILDLTKTEGLQPFFIDQIKSLQSIAKNLGKEISIEEFPTIASPFLGEPPAKDVK